jgi:hypothetical protein
VGSAKEAGIQQLVGVGAGVEQQARDLGQAVGPGRVQPVPLGGARRVQGGPAGPGVRPCGQPRVADEHLADLGGITQDHRGAVVVTGQPRVAGQHPGRPPGPVTDAGDQELIRPLPEFSGPGLNFGHEPWPAGVAVFAGDRELRGGERHRPARSRRCADGNPAQRDRITRPGGITKLLGPAPELIQARPRRKRLRRHVISSPAPHGPQLGRREDDTREEAALTRRTQSFPRTRARHQRAASS